VRVVESKEQRAQAIDGGKLSSLEPGRALPFPETPDERKVGNAPSLCFREGNVLIASFFLPKEDATHRMYHQNDRWNEGVPWTRYTSNPQLSPLFRFISFLSSLVLIGLNNWTWSLWTLKKKNALQ
jgi:hypothetical protein